jgi:hypothetical protein
MGVELGRGRGGAVEEMKKKNTEHGAHNSHGGQGETGCFDDVVPEATPLLYGIHISSPTNAQSLRVQEYEPASLS